jgi:hypothetical protein
VKPKAIKLPGLSLTAEMTVDGKAVKGKDVVVGDKQTKASKASNDSSSDSSSSDSSDSSGSSSESESESQKSPKKTMKLPGLTLTADMTVDKATYQGKTIVVNANPDKKESDSDSSSSSSDYYSDEVEKPATVPMLKITKEMKDKQEKATPPKEEEVKKEEKKEEEGGLAKLFGALGEGAKMQVCLPPLSVENSESLFLSYSF